MRKLIGPPKRASNAIVMKRLLANCVECECCGAVSHYKASVSTSRPVQVQIMGFVLTARRAMYMAAFPDKWIRRDRRITCRCKNPKCINPELLLQASAGRIASLDYQKGNRDRAAVAAHLARYTRALNTRLSEESVQRIREDERTGKFGAADFGISPEHFNAIKRGAHRRGSNPFAGLMA